MNCVGGARSGGFRLRLQRFGISAGGKQISGWNVDHWRDQTPQFGEGLRSLEKMNTAY